jgi:hypothetical protein
MTFVCALDEFQHNPASRFFATMWLPAIDFSKLVIVQGRVLNELCCVPFPDTKEQENKHFLNRNGRWKSGKVVSLEH